MIGPIKEAETADLLHPYQRIQLRTNLHNLGQKLGKITEEQSSGSDTGLERLAKYIPTLGLVQFCHKSKTFQV